MSSRPRRFLKVLLFLLGVPAALFVYVTVSLVIIHRVRGLEFSYEHAGTDLTFASSDGRWRGEEDLMLGREFPAVLVDFQLYRLRAQQPELRLLRTKPWKQPWKWAWWFDRRSNPKWSVPYVPPDHLPPAPTRLVLPAITPAERAAAQRAAEAYLQALR